MDEQQEASAQDYQEEIEIHLERREAALAEVEKTRRAYRAMAIALTAVALGIIIISTAMTSMGMLELRIQGHLLFISIFVFIIVAVIFFSGLRPAKKKAEKFASEIQELRSILEIPIQNEENEDIDEDVQLASIDEQEEEQEVVENVNGVADNLVRNSTDENMNDFYKILERGIVNPLVPDLPEYKSLRRKWFWLVVAAFVVMACALVMFYLDPSNSTMATIILVVSYLMLIGAFYIDRKRLKPMRNDWARRMNMTEFEARHSMHLNNSNSKNKKK